MRPKQISNVLCVFAAGLAVLSIVTAWVIQTFWPYYSNSWDFILWVGRALWISVAMMCGAIVLSWTSVSASRRSLRSILVVAIATLGFFVLDFRSRTQIVGSYTYTDDYTTRNIESWREMLSPLAGKPNIRALEIGTFEGRSAVWLFENVLTDPSSSITCIDIFNGAYELNFDRNMKPFGSRVKKIKAPSQVALRGLAFENYDFAYIDGSHAAKDVLIDAVLTWDLVKPDGLIIFDDYEWAGKFNGEAFTPKIAVDAFLRVMEPYVDIVHRGQQIVIRKRLKFNERSPQARP